MAHISMTQDEMKRKYDAMANDYIQWIEAANDNLIAADAISEAIIAAMKHSGNQPAMRLHWKILMFRAYAIECLLKAVYLKNGNRLASGGSFIHTALPKGHNLVAMWKLVSLPPLTKEWRGLLEKLTQISTSLGRYHIGLAWNKPKPNLAKNSIMDWTTGEDQVLESIIRELKLHFTHP